MTIVALGDPDDRQFAVGDRVVLAFLPACSECVRCVSGEGYMCADGAAANGRGELLRGGFRLHDAGGHVHHHLGVSAFANHAVIDRRSAVKIDADVPPEIAALFGCAVLTGVDAVLNSAQLRPGESVAIYGLGGGDGKTIIGSYLGSSIPARDVPRYIALWRAGRLAVERLLTSVSPLAEINTLFNTLAAGHAVRQVVIP